MDPLPVLPADPRSGARVDPKLPDLHQAQSPVRVLMAYDAGGRGRDYRPVAIGGYQPGHGFGPSGTFDQISARRSLCANTITTSLHK